MLCPWQGREKVNFWLQGKPAGEADCLLMVREGQQELILAIIPQSLSSFLSPTPLPVPILAGQGGGRLFPQGTLHPRRAEIIPQRPTTSYRCLCPSLNNILNTINTSCLSFANRLCLFLRNTHATMCLSCHLLLKMNFFFRNVKHCCRRSWESPDIL